MSSRPSYADGRPAAGRTGECGASRDAKATRQLRVLIVEDHRGAREAITEALALLGLRVAAVRRAEDAAALPSAPAFDLVVAELDLPGAPGTEAIAHLRRRWPAMRAVLTSSLGRERALERGLDPATTYFLEKPFGLAALTEAIAAAPAPSVHAEELRVG